MCKELTLESPKVFLGLALSSMWPIVLSGELTPNETFNQLIVAQLQYLVLHDRIGIENQDTAIPLVSMSLMMQRESVEGELALSHSV